MIQISFLLLDFFDKLEFKLVYYIYIFCNAPLYISQTINFYYCDLIINYNLYFINLSTKRYNLYDFDWLIELEFLNLTSDNYMVVGHYTQNINFFNVLSCIKFCIFFFLKFWFYIFIFLFVTKIIIIDFFSSIGLLTINQFFFEHEHNVGNGEDLLVVISFFFAIIFFNIAYFTLASTYLEFKIIMYLIFTVFILIPIRIILSFGSSLINFIRGSATSNKFWLELFYDSMMLLVFLVRFALQAIRIILVYIFYFSIHEYVFLLPKSFLVNINLNWENFGPNLFSRTIDFIRWSIELLDSTVSVCNQIASFFFVIFWLFSYINTFELKRDTMFWFDSIIIRICTKKNVNVIPIYINLKKKKKWSLKKV